MMRRLRGRRPSPALLVAIAALCVALVGTAVAGPVAGTSRLNKADRKVVIKTARTLALRYIKRFTPTLANREITQREPFLSVNVADSATLATTANRAKSAESADTAKTAEGVAEGAITSTELADNSVTGAKIGPDQVTGLNVDELTLGKVPSAFSADNAFLLGGLPASFYAQRIFARVRYEDSEPSLIPPSPGVELVEETAEGRVAVAFKQQIEGCGMVPGPSSDEGQIVRRIAGAGGTEEAEFAIKDTLGNPVRASFDLIVLC